MQPSAGPGYRPSIHLRWMLAAALLSALGSAHRLGHMLQVTFKMLKERVSNTESGVQKS